MRQVIRSVVVLSVSLFSFFPTRAAGATEPPGRPAGTKYQEEPVSVVSSAGNITLHGSLLLPAGNGPFPAVVLLPDMGADEPGYDGLLLHSLADSLASQGIVTLRLDERGTGRSGGKPGQTVLTERLADVAAALNKLRTQLQVDITRIGLVGHGLGGNVALLAGAQPLPPAFIVAMAASGVRGQELLVAQVPMYGKVFTTDYDQLARQRQLTLGQLQTRQVAFQMQAHGASPAQIQAYTDQQTHKLREADQQWLTALQKHQQAMLEIVVHTPDDGQAQAVLANMLQQHYPDASPEEIYATAHRMTSRMYRDYLTLTPSGSLPSVKCPVLVVQGTADAQVSAALNVEALLKGLSANSKVAERRWKDLDHYLRPPTAAGDKSQVAAPLVYREIGHWIALIR